MAVPVAIAAAYELKPGRYPDLGPKDMYRAVVRGALKAWNLRPQDVDGVLSAPSGLAAGDIDILSHEKIVAELGIHPPFSETLSAGGASFAIMVLRAAAAIRDGQATSVLCLGAGKFVKQGVGSGELLARVSSEPDYEIPYGPFIPALYALVASQFMAERGATAEDLARVAVSARRWSLLNPDALMHAKGPITVEEVLASRMIAAPFHYLDCSVPTDGGGAVLVTTAAKARALTPQPAYILGYGETHGHASLSEAGTRLIDTGALVTGETAFRRAGLGPRDIQVAQLYDAFSFTPLLLLENLGFCASGEAGRFIQSGATDPGGSLPMNTGGGLLSFGHTGEASGMSVLVEGAKQAMGVAGARQAEPADRVLVHVYGGMMYEHATIILGRSEGAA